MSSQGYTPDPLSEDDLRKLLLEAIQKSPDYSNPESYHALFDHLERGLSTDDIIHALEGVWSVARKKFNKDEWQWKYEIDATSIEGEPITVIVAVDSVNRDFTIITRWRE
jgi:hypothetical protein